MKSFRFTLEAVGIVRQRQEQKAMEFYAQTLLAHRRTVEALEEAETELSASWQAWHGQMAAGCPAGEAMQVLAFHRSLTQRRDKCAVAVAAAERRVSAALPAMLLARQQREIVD